MIEVPMSWVTDITADTTLHLGAVMAAAVLALQGKKLSQQGIHATSPGRTQRKRSPSLLVSLGTPHPSDDDHFKIETIETSDGFGDPPC